MKQLWILVILLMAMSAYAETRYEVVRESDKEIRLTELKTKTEEEVVTIKILRDRIIGFQMMRQRVIDNSNKVITELDLRIEQMEEVIEEAIRIGVTEEANINIINGD